MPDAPRVEVAGGIGWHERWIALDAGYMAVILRKETSTSPDFRATYESTGHVISLTATVRFVRVGRHVSHEEPPPELPDEPEPRRRY